MPATAQPYAQFIGVPLLPEDRHAVSVSLPTWESVIQYKKDGKIQKSEMKFNRIRIYGYPRFHIHPAIEALSQEVMERLGLEMECGLRCMVFPTESAAMRFKARVQKAPERVDIVHFALPTESVKFPEDRWIHFYPTIFPIELNDGAMAHWTETGDGVSSRQADICLKYFNYLQSISAIGSYLTPAQRYRIQDEEWMPSGEQDKDAVKELIANLTTSEDGRNQVGVENVLLSPSGMNAICTVSRALSIGGNQDEVVGFGWLYGETRSILEYSNWGKVTFYSGRGTEDLDSLEASLASGWRIRALFCEFPNNLLLGLPDLSRIRALADKYRFIVVCDDSVSTPVNTDLFPFVDIRVASLTKMFSGACNVTGGSVTVNPLSPYYTEIQTGLYEVFEDTLFPLDAIALRINSVDMVDRVRRANANAMPVVQLLSNHSSVAQVNHPSLGSVAKIYDQHRHQKRGGYGQLLGIIFRNPSSAEIFYDALDVCKGASFGTNFTLCLPHVMVGHFHELEFAETHGAMRHTLRLSVGLEDRAELLKIVTKALEAVKEYEKTGR
ncbi:pyridoxal phosphate-dependent transferase [Aspergillus avenaceus]|uniref:Pyridoxal phosphate-dependent transferase n=1 Tax=Aspergillus avenaceus TaxID=36643 RepID=A0A5N6TSD8_ASPAV|nr:pyridoxal phosphate-dependent transferase [Aspergillus avenaceus]